MPTLVYWDSDGIERVFELGTEPVMIGRAAECAIRSEDTRVSRRHARLISNGRDCWIEDMGSSNGVYVGPNRATQSIIPPGEIVIVGSILLQLQAVPGEVPRTSTGTHAQLSVWLKMEREKHVTLARERDNLAERVKQVGGGGGADPAEIKRMRTQMAADHARDIERMHKEAEAAKEQAIAKVRADLEAQFEATKQALVEDANRQRTEIDVSDQLQVQVQQLWSNLRAAKQTIRQHEEAAKERENRVAAAEKTRSEMQEHTKKLANEVRRLSQQDKQRQEQLETLQTERQELVDNRTDLEVQLAEMQEIIDQGEGKLAQQAKAAEAKQAELQAALDDANVRLEELTDAGEDTFGGATDDITVGDAERIESLVEAQALWKKERQLLIEERDELADQLIELREDEDEERERSQTVLAQAKARLQELAREADKVTVERDELAADYDQLGAQYDELVAERDELIQEVERLEAARGGDESTDEQQALMHKQAQQADEEVQRLTEDRARLRRESESLQDRLGELESVIRERDDEREQMQAELAGLREKSQSDQDSDIHLAAMHKEKYLISKERERLANELDGMTKERDKLSSELGSLRAARATERQDFAAQLRTVQGELDRVNHELREVNVELASAMAQATELASIRERFAALESDKQLAEARLQSTIEKLNADVNDIEALLKERDQEISSLREREDELAVELEHAHDLRAQLEQIREERDQINSRADDLTADLSASIERAGALETQNAQLSTAFEDAKIELRSLHDKFVDAPQPDELQEQNQNLCAQIDDLRAELSEVSEQASQYANERALRRTAEDEISELNQQIASLEREVKALSDVPVPSGGDVSSAATEHLMTIQDCIAALRTNMRAASDETAVMPGDSDSVQVVIDAISQATEQIETARDSMRALGELFDLD